MTDEGGNIKFVITNIEVSAAMGDGEFEPVNHATEHIEFVKLVPHVSFWKDGTADIWIDISVGNCSSVPIKINKITVTLENSGSKPRRAKSDYVREEYRDVKYIWNEKRGDWTTMYTGYQELNGENSVHRKKNTEAGDRVFYHELGSGDNLQHVILTPVTFKPDNAELASDDPTIHDITEMKTMASRNAPVLLPAETVGEACPACSSNGPTEQVLHKDGLTIWAKWDNVNVMRKSDQIDFEFEFEVDSRIGKITNAYLYYILPEGAEFQGSDSQDTVEVFHPRNPHFMFRAWEEPFQIKKTGPDKRVLRSKIKNVEHAHNLGEYRLTDRHMANELLQNFVTTLAPALLATLLSAIFTASLFRTPTIGIQHLLLILIVTLFAMMTFLTLGIYVTIFGRYTFIAKYTLMAGRTIDESIERFNEGKEWLDEKIRNPFGR